MRKQHEVFFLLNKQKCFFHVFKCIFVFQVCVRPFVEKHTENLPTFPAHNPSVETLSSESPGNVMRELPGGDEDKENICNVSINSKVRIEAFQVLW